MIKDTIFTKIAKRELNAYIIHENDEFMAFLDINPSTYGQTLVIPKDWHDSYIFRNDNDFIQKFIIYVKEIASLLDQKLGSERCILIFEGFGVDHLHAKLYPAFVNSENSTDFNKSEKLSDKTAKEILGKINFPLHGRG